MGKIDAVKKMYDKAADRYGDNHPVTEALARQYHGCLKNKTRPPTARATDSALSSQYS